jgi:hypothetical protein
MKVKWMILLALPIAFGGVVSCKKKGCTDATATNYKEEAKKDDESCVYLPTISLIGSASVTVQLGDAYEDAGATATNKDGSSVNVIETSNNVNTALAGTYQVVYSATNAQGTVSVTRTVTVVVGADNWVGNWTLSSTCSGSEFPLNTNPIISEAASENGLEISEMFNYLGVIFGTAQVIFDGQNLTVPEQNYNNNGVNITYSGSGTLNNEGTIAIVNYTYDNTTPFVGGQGTCTATYIKQ